MTIGIDASRANKSNRTGVEWYSFYIIQELKKIILADNKVVLYTGEKLKDGLENMPANWQEKILSWPPKYLWTQIRLWWELVLNPPDVLYVPAHTIPLLPIPKKIKVICVVHDVGFKRSPELYKKIQFWYHDLTMRRIKSRANIIITISQFSKDEIIDLYHIEPERIKITYLGYDSVSYHPIEHDDSALLDKYKIAKPYLLYVGRLEKKKNIANIVEAFILAKKQFLDLKLVLAGNPGNEYGEVMHTISDAGLTKDIIVPGYVDESDMPQLMATASALLFPTLYEGFGLPLVQAMACSTPIVTSNINPHKEIAGEAAMLVDPYSPKSIADGIISILSNPDLRQKLSTAGINRAKEFHWSKTAEQTAHILTT